MAADQLAERGFAVVFRVVAQQLGVGWFLHLLIKQPPMAKSDKVFFDWSRNRSSRHGGRVIALR
jgi:hypothetical protein